MESLTEIQSKISSYLRASAGTLNWPTDHTLRCFVGMIESGEATFDDFRTVGGDWIVSRIKEAAAKLQIERRISE